MKLFEIVRYTSFCVALLFASLIAFPAHAWSIEKMNTQIDNTNVIVGGVCSGTIISIEDRLVLTAYHCINDRFEDYEEETVGDDGTVKIEKKKRKLPLQIWTNKVRDYEIVSTVKYSAKIVASDAKNDVALLQVTDTDYVPAQAVVLAPDTYKYQRGLRVYAVGNPGIEFDNSISEGIIAAPERSVDFGLGGVKQRLFQHSATTIGGNSGGSILNEEGELIGTVTGGIRGAAISFAIPVRFTKDMLKRAGFTKIIPSTDNKPVINAPKEKGPQ